MSDDADRPRRIRRRRTKGWRMPEGAKYVGRPTFFGNPFEVGAEASITVHEGMARHVYRDWRFEIDPAVATAMYRVLTLKRLQKPTGDDVMPLDVDWWERFMEKFEDLAGRDLACWCPLDQPCHADVLLELANNR